MFLSSRTNSTICAETRLKKAQGMALAQLQLLQKQQEKEGDAQQQQQQINQLLLKNAELEKTVKDLTEVRNNPHNKL